MVAAGLVAMASPAYAATITITPATVQQWTSNNNGNFTAADACALTLVCGLTELYKADVPQSGPNAIESGGLAGSYSTAFSNSQNDPSDATITYTGGTAVNCAASTGCLLVVKDGNQTPAVYVFNLKNLDNVLVDGNFIGPNIVWNGTDTLFLDNFWPGNGAISHVSLLAQTGENFQVPEPTSFSMLGFGLATLVARRVRKARANA
jgi:hypothetical protein